MLSLLSYLNDRYSSIIFVIAQNIINHVFLLNIQFVLMDISVQKKKIVLCATLISFFYLTPIYLLSFVSVNGAINAFFYNILIFITPPAALIYYFVIKRVFKFSPVRSNIVLRNQLLMHYIVVLYYMIINNAFVAKFGNTTLSKGFYLGDLVSIIAVIIILAVVYLVLKAVLGKNRKYMIIPPAYSEKDTIKNVLNVIFTTTVIYLVLLFFRTEWINAIRTPLTATTGFFYLILIISILLYLLYTISRLQIRLYDWEAQATGTYISSLLHANQEFRHVKHDFFNMLQVYSGYIEVEDYDGLKKYHKALFNTTKQAGDFLSIIEILRPRIAVYSLLEAMAEKAEKVGVGFSINQVCDITNVVLSDLELCRMLGIVIDNALEEAAMSVNKQVNISFESKSEKTIVLIISNTTKGDVNVKRIFDDGYTTKDNHAGIGLPQVMHIINSYENCFLKVNYHDNQFTMFLILYADHNLNQ